MAPTELLEKLLFVFFGAWALVETCAEKNAWSMFGSAITPHLTNPSGGSSSQEHGAETPERLCTDAAVAETADRKLFQATAESLLPLGCLYTVLPSVLHGMHIIWTFLLSEEP